MNKARIKAIIIAFSMLLQVHLNVLRFILNSDKDLFYTVGEATQKKFPKLRVELLISMGANVKYKDLNTSSIELGLYSKNMELLSLLTKKSGCLDRLEFYKMAKKIYKKKELLQQIGKVLKINFGEECLRATSTQKQKKQRHP